MRTSPIVVAPVVAAAALALAAAACTRAAFHPTTPAPLPPVADRAVVAGDGDAAALAARGARVGTIDARGLAFDDLRDLADRAAQVAAVHGGTHVVATAEGVVTQTSVTPAREERTCTRSDDDTTCTTTYVPASTTTTSLPYAGYDVYRVEPARWGELAPALVPPPYDADHHAATVADGFGFTLGYAQRPYFGATGAGTSGRVFPTAYHADPAQIEALWLGFSWERAATVLALDVELGGGSQTGTAMNVQDGTASVPYTLDFGGARLGLRAGRRVAWHEVAFAIGAGLEGAITTGIAEVDHSAPIEASFVEPPATALDLAVPLWGALTIKPGCDWGAQVLASYELRPFDRAASAPALAVGLIWQPASACR